ncbi:hypothetical protein, partial [Oscillibacter sp. 1-3]|uniref:hypothetical protein n=2 Tax=Oscillibacter sp. 1-3 TaxID=1235797 RepID=UPI001A99B651
GEDCAMMGVSSFLVSTCSAGRGTEGKTDAEVFTGFSRSRPCLKKGGMPNGERFFRQSRQIFAGGLTPGKKI